MVKCLDAATISITIPDSGAPEVSVETNKRKEQLPKKCPQCQNTFIPFRSNQRFCSDIHGAQYRKAIKRVKEDISRNKPRTSVHLPPKPISKDSFYQAQLKKAAKKHPNIYKDTVTV
jgi:hypothetical protein